MRSSGEGGAQARRASTYNGAPPLLRPLLIRAWLGSCDPQRSKCAQEQAALDEENEMGSPRSRAAEPTGKADLFSGEASQSRRRPERLPTPGVFHERRVPADIAEGPCFSVIWDGAKR